MNFLFVGHDYKYAAEQIMLTLFPEERPVYSGPVGPEALSAKISLSHGPHYSTAVTVLYYGGAPYRGVARIQTPDPADTLEWNRQMQKLIRFAFYRAATAATGQTPAWGALSGIRPGKLATARLESGQSPRSVKAVLERDYQVSPQRAELCIHTAQAGLAVKKRLHPLDVCLYIGIPFCPTRCTYCSFVSNSVEKSMHLVEPFLEALTREIQATSQVVNRLGLRISALYIGGGTPTTLTGAQLTQLTDTLASQFDLSHLQEYTVEAGRPDTLDQDKLRRLRQAGVTRLSINPQSMEDHVLAAIGRRHTAEDIRRAMELARAENFPVLNMDLIAGLPADSPAGFARTLEQALALEAENITIHTLSMKKGTKLMLEATETAASEAVAQMLDTAISALSGGGYLPYYLYRQKFIAGGFENVGWCRPGAESLYNIAIMEELCSILALGGGASTKLVASKTGHITRIFNAKYPYEYIENLDKILASKEQIEGFYQQEVF